MRTVTCLLRERGDRAAHWCLKSGVAGGRCCPSPPGCHSPTSAAFGTPEFGEQVADSQLSSLVLEKGTSRPGGDANLLHVLPQTAPSPAVPVLRLLRPLHRPGVPGLLGSPQPALLSSPSASLPAPPSRRPHLLGVTPTASLPLHLQASRRNLPKRQLIVACLKSFSGSPRPSQESPSSGWRLRES